MTVDAGLRAIFRDHLKQVQWTSIETGGTGRGIPDSEFCFPGGVTGWIEFKAAEGWAVDMRPEQVGWLARRARMGGAAFVAVRRQAPAGPRRGPAVDELWLFPAGAAKTLKQQGLRGAAAPLGCWPGGPAAWDWAAVTRALTV